MRSVNDFPNQPTSVGAAREFVGSVLEPHGLDDVLARIVTSELATNAVRHAQTPFRVLVEVRPGIIRIEVEDGAGAQKIATEMASDHTGRGLLIVETAATSWGVERRGEKKAVWIEIPAVPILA
jgi:anti-sigma regulatory factor (Ser/Thr protein kinase)